VNTLPSYIYAKFLAIFTDDENGGLIYSHFGYLRTVRNNSNKFDKDVVCREWIAGEFGLAPW
jgi:hypothetical protein